MAAPDGDPEGAPVPPAQEQLTAKAGAGNAVWIQAWIDRIENGGVLEAGEQTVAEAQAAGDPMGGLR